MTQLKRVIAILCILSLQSDLLGHFAGSFLNGTDRIIEDIDRERRGGWWDVFVFAYRINPLRLYYAWAATARYADNATQGLCANGSNAYNPKTRRCDDGGTDLVYIGITAVQLASVAAAPGDTIYIRGWSGVYTGTNPSGRIEPRQGTSPSNRTRYEGYQSENPRVRGFNCEALNICFATGHDDGFNPAWDVYILNLTLDGENINGNLLGNFGQGRAENLEIKNSRNFGILAVSNAELINLTIHDNGVLNPTECGDCHGVYGGPHLLIDGGRYYNHPGSGIQCYRECGNTTIRNIRLDHNGSHGVFSCDSCDQFVPRQGTLIRMYNLIVDHNGGYGLHLASALVTEVYNSSFSNNAGAICVDSSGVTVRNVIAPGDVIQSNCNTYTGSFTSSNNVTSGSPVTYFVDSANGDFHLNDNATTRSTTPGVGVIGQGFNTLSIFTCDFGNGTGCASGATRTAPVDIGAYKFGAAPPVDTQPPVLAISSPFAGAYTTKTTMTFSGTATDDFGVTSVTSACTSGNGTATLIGSAWTRAQALNLGANTCTFTANDLAGNTGATAVASVTVTRVAAPTPGLVASYAFDTGSGTSAIDSSGNGNTGTFNGAITWVTGKTGYGNAIRSNGNPTAYVTVPDANSLHLIDNWTLSAWVNPDVTTNNWRPVVAKFDHVYFLYAMSVSFCPGGAAPIGGFQSNAVSFNQFTTCSSTPLVAGQYSYISTTYDGDTLKFYTNGTLVGSTTVLGGTGPGTGPLLIAHDDNSGSNPGYQGIIDDVRIYNRALTQAEITTDMITPILGAGTPPPVVIKLNVTKIDIGPGTSLTFGFAP